MAFGEPGYRQGALAGAPMVALPPTTRALWQHFCAITAAFPNDSANARRDTSGRYTVDLTDSALTTECFLEVTFDERLVRTTRSRKLGGIVGQRHRSSRRVITASEARSPALGRKRAHITVTKQP